MGKIPLNKENIIALEATEKVNEIFDANTGEKVVDRAYDWILPIPILVDLNGIYDLTEIAIFDLQAWSGGTSLKVYAGTDPFDLQFVYADSLSNANVWNRKALNLKGVRYIKFEATGVKSWFSEVEIHGEKVGDIPEPATVNYVPENLPMKKRIGGKCFIDDPWDKLEQVYGFPNDYANWQWFEEYENQYRFSDSALGDYLKWANHWKNKGIDHFPIIKESPVWFRTAANGIVQKPMVQPIREPYNKPEDKLDVHKPETHASVFKDWLEFLEQYLIAVQPEYLLLFNETDKLWDGRKSWSKPWELAAVMIQSQKVRDRVSPHTKLIMGGLAGINLDYTKSMKLYCDRYNGGKFCSDGVTYHEYSNNQGGQMTDLETPPATRFGISPEDSDLRGKGKEAVDYVHNVIRVPCYLFEFGFDTNPGSKQTAGSEQRQADWIVRNYAAAIEAGFDRVAMYMFRDPGKPTSDGLYSTSGLVTEKGQWKEKPSFFAMKEYKEKVQNLKYVGETRQGEAYIQQYAEGDSAVYMYWTNKGTAPVNINGMNLTASETPKYLVSGPTPLPPPVPPPPTTTTMKIGYSTKPDRTDFKEITDGLNLPQGNLYIEAREVTPTVNFTLKKLDGTVIHIKYEGQRPYDLHGGNAWSAPAGDYSLTVKDKTSEKTVTFRVGEVTPPPTPPPTTKPLVTVNVSVPPEVDLKVLVNGVQK